MLKPKNGNLQSVNEEVKTEAVAEPATAGAVKSTKSGRPKDMQKVAAVKAFREAGETLAMEEDANGVEKGAGQADVAYVIALGNPTSWGTRTEGKTEKIPTMNIVGWKFRALKDIKVPVCKREGIPKNDTMGYSSIEWVNAAAGSEFTLSPAELGEMISLEQYNGMFTGDPENVVELHVTMPKVGKGRYAPSVSLKRVKTSENTKPLKADIVPVATLNEGADKKSTSIKDYTVLPEYAEKFGYIFEPVERTGRGSSGSTARKPGENAAELAAALRAYKSRQQ